MYDWVMGITCLLVLVCLAGMAFRLPIFFNRRRWAWLAFVFLPVIGVSLAKTVASPEQKIQIAKDDAELAAFHKQERDAGSRGYKLELSNTAWSATCGGDCLSLSGTVTNPSGRDRKDPVIKCTFEGESGTVIRVRRETLYKAVPAGKSVRFKGLDMGFKPGQSTTATCGVLASSEG